MSAGEEESDSVGATVREGTGGSEGVAELHWVGVKAAGVLVHSVFV